MVALPASAEAIPVEESGAPVSPTMAPDEATPAEEARATPPASSPDPPPKPANPTIAVDEPEPEPEPEVTPEPAAEPRLHDPGPTELRPDPIRPGRSDFDELADVADPPPAEAGPAREPARDKPANPTIAVDEREPQVRDPGPRELRPDPVRPARSDFDTPAGFTTPSEKAPQTEPNQWEQLYAVPDPPEPRGGGEPPSEREAEDEPRAEDEPTATSGTDALGILLVKPMELDAGAVEDPVLRDRLCRVEAVGQCDPERANERLELDRARGLFVPPNYERQSSPFFLEEEREQAEREREARAESDGGFEMPGWVKETGGAIKGIGESVYRLSPANRRLDPESWQRENEAVGRGFVESAKGIKDSAVSIYRLSPQNRRSNPEDWARANAELGRTAQYAYDNPWAFTKQVAGGMVNWEDLSEGRYGEWLGGFGPDAIITAATWGTGTAVNGSLRGVRAGTGAMRDTPDSAPDLPGERSPKQRSDDPVERVLEVLDDLDPGARARIDDSPESRDAIAGMLRDSSSGTSGNTTRPDRFQPSRTRGHVSELRVLLDMARRPDVVRVTPIPAASGARTPDFVVELDSGEVARVEVRTITGAGPGYQDTGVGRAAAPSAADVRTAIRSKVGGGRTQFNEPLGDVPEGGILSLHLRGPAGPGAAAADDAVEAMSARLVRAKVNVVEVNLTDKTVVRYTVDRDGGIARRLIAAR